MGRGLAFVGRQYHIKTDTKHFYIDLVFYNFLLKYCLIYPIHLWRGFTKGRSEKERTRAPIYRKDYCRLSNFAGNQGAVRKSCGSTQLRFIELVR